MTNDNLTAIYESIACIIFLFIVLISLFIVVEYGGSVPDVNITVFNITDVDQCFVEIYKNNVGWGLRMWNVTEIGSNKADCVMLKEKCYNYTGLDCRWFEDESVCECLV